MCWGEARRFREQRGGIVGRWETYEALGRYWEQQGGTGGQQGDIGGRGEIGAPSSDGGQRRGLGDSRGF